MLGMLAMTTAEKFRDCRRDAEDDRADEDGRSVDADIGTASGGCSCPGQWRHHRPMRMAAIVDACGCGVQREWILWWLLAMSVMTTQRRHI